MNKQRQRYYRTMFYSGALFNWSVAILWLVAFQEMYTLMGGETIPQDPIFNLFLQLISILIFLFGGVYYSIGRSPDSVASRSLATIGMIGKLIFVILFFSYAIAGSIPWALAALVSVDLLYAVLFFEYVFHDKFIPKNMQINHG